VRGIVCHYVCIPEQADQIRTLPVLYLYAEVFYIPPEISIIHIHLQLLCGTHFYFLFCALIALSAFTVTYGLIFPNSLSPIPSTFFRSSTFTKGPCFSLNLTIACDFFSPSPGIAAISSAEAIFTFNTDISPLETEPVASALTK